MPPIYTFRRRDEETISLIEFLCRPLPSITTHFHFALHLTLLTLTLLSPSGYYSKVRAK